MRSALVHFASVLLGVCGFVIGSVLLSGHVDREFVLIGGSAGVLVAVLGAIPFVLIARFLLTRIAGSEGPRTWNLIGAGLLGGALLLPAMMLCGFATNRLVRFIVPSAWQSEHAVQIFFVSINVVIGGLISIAFGAVLVGLLGRFFLQRSRPKP